MENGTERNSSFWFNFLKYFQISQLKSHTLAMQQAYTKRVIEIFDLTPERLGVTQDYLCDVFERCPASTTKSQISEQNEIVTEESVQETSTEATNEDEIVVEEETTIKPSIEETSTIVQETTSNVQESTSNFQETTIVTEEAVKETTTEKEVSTAQGNFNQFSAFFFLSLSFSNCSTLSAEFVPCLIII